MASISATLIPSTTFSSSIVLPIEGGKAKGCGYFGQQDGLHTVQYSLHGFKGHIVIQGSLEGKPTDDDWFDISSASYVGNHSPSESATITENFKGNFVWVRAVVQAFTAGDINRVLLSHN